MPHVHLTGIRAALCCLLIKEHNRLLFLQVFIGSCMTNIGHFRAAGKLLKASGKPATAKLWVAPPTKMDESTRREYPYGYA